MSEETTTAEVKPYRVVELKDIVGQEATEATETPDSTDVKDPDPAAEEVGKTTTETPPAAEEYDEEKIVSFFKSRGREVSSLEDLLREPEEKIIEKEVELPEHVSAYKKYYEETGRSFADWANLNRDFKSMDPDQVLVEHLTMEHPEWSKKDVLSEINDQFGYDPDDVSEADIAKIERKKATAVAQAVKALEEAKQKYAAPLASRELVVSDDEKAAYEAFKQHRSQSESTESRNREVAEEFSKKSMELFSPEFKGFELKVGDKEIVYLPDSPDKILKSQIDIRDVMKSLVLDEEGRVKDPKDYHMRLSAFRDPSAFAKHFYDQGKADQVVEFDKESKNLHIDRRPNETPPAKGTGTTYRVVEDPNSHGRLSIKAPKNS